MKAYFQKRILEFIHAAGTSRGVLKIKPSWYIYLYDELAPDYKGIGEVSIIPGLSKDDENTIEQKLSVLCAAINENSQNLDEIIADYPAIKFGLETALLDFESKGSKILFESDFTRGESGIPTNGLIWMGNSDEMMARVKQKLDAGFRCLKMKIGAVDIEEELQIIRNLRREYSSSVLELRVDANGAFTYTEAKGILQKLADWEVHSIEQPIMPTQIDEMADLCSTSPIPVALDEELIGIAPYENKFKLIDIIRPQYLILKPSLLGGLGESNDWINIAKQLGIGWWVTSALESNIGLSAIAQWVAGLETSMHQGLGLGNLYKKNIDSPLELHGEKLFYNTERKWRYEFVY